MTDRSTMNVIINNKYYQTKNIIKKYITTVIQLEYSFIYQNNLHF